MNTPTPTPTPRTDGLTVKAPDIQYYIPPTQPSYIPPTQRERIAVAAMQGMLAGRQAALDTPYVVHRSMEIADALIAALSK